VPGSNEQVKLFVMQDETGQARLVYLVSWLAASKEPSRPFVMIDAQTGSELKRWEDQPQGRHRPGGNVKTGKYFYGADFGPLQVDDNCRMTGTNVDTLNMNHGTTGAPSTSSPARRTRSRRSTVPTLLSTMPTTSATWCSTCTATGTTRRR
jgi:Zn-dependent metalloprotease